MAKFVPLGHAYCLFISQRLYRSLVSNATCWSLRNNLLPMENIIHARQ